MPPGHEQEGGGVGEMWSIEVADEVAPTPVSKKLISLTFSNPARPKICSADILVIFSPK
jgi:hypothetical protein